MVYTPPTILSDFRNHYAIPHESTAMESIENRADLLLLDTGSIMALVFGGLAILLLAILAVGLVFQFSSNVILVALVVSALLAVNGLGLIALSTSAR